MKHQPKALTPKLRFPKFKEPWEGKKIARYIEECSSRVAAPTKLPVYTSSRVGLKPQQDYYGSGIILNDGDYGVVPPECFVYRHMSDDGIFAFNTNETGGDIAVSKEYPVFRAMGIDRHFLLTKLNHSPEFKAFALSHKAGGTRTRLYFSKLRTWETLLPCLAEQRKIGECLTSLDKLLAAEGRKLEALRAHKKGLMQDLFPRPSESLPRLRFPEFRDAPEWKTEKIGDVFDTATGGTPERTVKAYWDGGIPWVTTSLVDFNVIVRTDETISAEGLNNSAAKMFPKGTILMALYGQGKTRGKVAMLGIEATTNQACAAILPSGEVDQTFAFLNLAARYDKIRAFSNAGGQENLSQGLLRELPFWYPSEPAEQQRIAACLSSLDTLIAAQSRKVDGLRAHKKGLIQQLFPTLAGQ